MRFEVHKDHISLLSYHIISAFWLQIDLCAFSIRLLYQPQRHKLL